MEVLNRETLVIVMIETAEAVANATEIAAVPGIDVLFIGTNDLCADQGIPGEYGHASVDDAYRKTIEACRKYKKWPGMGGLYDDKLMAKFIGAGIQFESGSFETLIRLVDSGLGATVLPELVVASLSPERRAAQVRPFSGAVPVRQIGLVTSRRELQARVTAKLYSVARSRVQSAVARGGTKTPRVLAPLGGAER